MEIKFNLLIQTICCIILFTSILILLKSTEKTEQNLKKLNT